MRYIPLAPHPHWYWELCPWHNGETPGRILDPDLHRCVEIDDATLTRWRSMETLFYATQEEQRQYARAADNPDIAAIRFYEADH